MRPRTQVPTGEVTYVTSTTELNRIFAHEPISSYTAANTSREYRYAMNLVGLLQRLSLDTPIEYKEYSEDAEAYAKRVAKLRKQSIKTYHKNTAKMQNALSEDKAITQVA